jgi:hypothetical protein
MAPVEHRDWLSVQAFPVRSAASLAFRPPVDTRCRATWCHRGERRRTVLLHGQKSHDVARECRRLQRFELGPGLLVDFGQEMAVTVVGERDARMPARRAISEGSTPAVAKKATLMCLRS